MQKDEEMNGQQSSTEITADSIKCLSKSTGDASEEAYNLRTPGNEMKRYDEPESVKWQSIKDLKSDMFGVNIKGEKCS